MPLFWAAEQGHDAVVKLLLGMDSISLNHTIDSQTSLLMAAVKEHDAVVKIFLAKDGVQHICGNICLVSIQERIHFMITNAPAPHELSERA